MNIERNNATENEVEYVEKDYKQTSKFKKFELLVFIGCLAFAFLMWCYANYMDNPIIQKEVKLEFEYEGDGTILSIPSTIVIYGEESVLSNIQTITVKIDGTLKKGEKKTIKVDLPEDVYSHNREIEIFLSGPTNQPDQNQSND